MDFWIPVLSVAALIFAYPYVRVFAKRLSLKAKIMRLCKANNYHFIRNRAFWFLGGKKGSSCDFYIETPTEIYSVKLLGMKKKWSMLLLHENGDYSIRKFIMLLFAGQTIHFPIESSPCPLPAYNFRKDFNNDWDIKTPHNILLVNPVGFDIRRRSQNGREKIIGAGETWRDIQVYSLARFLGELESKNE